MPSSMLLMTVSRRSLLRRAPGRAGRVIESAIVLNSRASQEMVSEPSAGTRCSRSPLAISRAVVSNRCSRRRTTTRTTSAMRGDQQQRQRGGPGHHPAQIPIHAGADRLHVQVEHQHAVDRSSGSWHSWHSGLFLIGMTVRSTAPPRVSITRLSIRCAAGNWWQAWQVGESGCEVVGGAQRRARELHRRLAIEQRHLLGVRLPAEGLDHLRDERPVVLRASGIRAPTRISSPSRQRGLAGVFEQRLRMVGANRGRRRRRPPATTASVIPTASPAVMLDKRGSRASAPDLAGSAQRRPTRADADGTSGPT